LAAPQVELLSLIGDVALKDGEPQVHAHAVVGKRDGTAHGTLLARLDERGCRVGTDRRETILHRVRLGRKRMWSSAMGAKRVINGVHVVPMGMANAFLIEGDDGLTLIDAGFPGREAAVFGAIRGLGRSPDQLKHLIFTHGHPDHIGSAAAIVRKAGARTYMHPLDIPMAESGGPFRPMTAAPGLLRRVMCKLFFDPDERLEPVCIDQPMTDGETLPIAGGIEVIHTPGHCAGHVALLWLPGRMLFAGDVYTNLMGLGDPVGFENLEEGRSSQRKLADLSFDAAGFGHGGPIARNASTYFRNMWDLKSAA
jgi:glyoxylase-like metal-dependent hydrolase (beta-lactamase superfamily II)